jgi:hypothetical protein
LDPNQNGWTATDRLDSFDCTLANLSELVCACLDAAQARSVAEIGAEHGLFTQELLEWRARTGSARVAAVDPSPRARLRDLAGDHPELELIVGTSHAVLPEFELPDALILDGDHNYFTVSEELRLISDRAPGAELPLLFLHDIGWPLGRRDSYHDPERIPAEHRRPLARDAFLVPGEPGIAERGLYYACTAAEEGGDRNGVLTAVEDFLAERPELRMAIVAPFFGLGVVWHRDAPRASEVEAVLAPWDGNAMLERIEAKRIEHLVAEFQNLQQIDALRSADYELRFDLVGKLLPIERSSAFALAERLSRLRQGGAPNFSRAQLQELLQQLAGDDIRLGEMGAEEPDPAAPPASQPAPPITPAGPDLASDSA